MKNTARKTILLIFCILLFLTSCMPSQDIDLDITTKTINYLTSDDCYGRLPGTEGNILAQNYIVEEFKNIGLEPYTDSFLLPYTKKNISIIAEDVALQLYKGGEVIEFEYGQDFVEVEVSDFTIELPIYDTVKDQECILLVENIKEAQEYKNNEKVKACLVLQNDLKRSIPMPELFGHSIPFRINQHTYDTLKENLGQTVRLAMNIEEKEVEQNNVVAKITGENNEQALVITAHFDHVGGIKDFIYRGALDNASGVASLLNIAQQLKETYKIDKPPIDIIFAAVNSEETLTSKYGCGSAKLAQDLKDKNYSIFNINLDCIGSIDHNPISIDINRNEFSKAQGENIAKYFTENDLEGKIEEGICCSDQQSFKYGLAITTLSPNSIIHSVKDTKDKIDINYINQISDLISTYIIKNISDIIVPQNINDDIYTIIHKEEETLDFGEYKFIEINGEIEYVDRKILFDNITNINNDLTQRMPVITQLLSVERTPNIFIELNWAEDIPYDGQKLNMTFNRDYEYKDISSIRFSWHIKSDTSEETVQIVVIYYDLSNESSKEIFTLEQERFGENSCSYNDYVFYYKYEDGPGGVINAVSNMSNETYKYIISIANTSIIEFDSEKIIELIEKYNLLELHREMIKFMSKEGELEY